LATLQTIERASRQKKNFLRLRVAVVAVVAVVVEVASGFGTGGFRSLGDSLW
jgi:uncharacterized membrane protein